MKKGLSILALQASAFERGITVHQQKEKLSVYGQLQRRLKKGLSISVLQTSAQERGITVHQQPTVQQLSKEIKTLQDKIKVSQKESAERR